MEVRLVAESGARRRHTFTVPGQATVIGRRRGCGVRVPSASVSREHCRLEVRGGLVAVVDLHSANGTFLNGRRVHNRTLVRPGDRLRVGPVTFVVEYEPDPAALERLQVADAAQVADAEFFEVVEAELVAEEDDVPELDLADSDPDTPLPVEDEEEALPALLAFDDEDANLPEGQQLRDLLSELEQTSDED